VFCIGVKVVFHLRKEAKLQVFESNGLMRICRPKCYEGSGKLKILHNEGRRDLLRHIVLLRSCNPAGYNGLDKESITRV
jgi:hypothetical protein